MRAVVHDRYGPPEVLRIEEVEKPVPKDDEVLIRIHATTVNRTDTGLRSANVLASRLVTGLRRPRQTILGTEFAGDVAAAGTSVTEFKVGDSVFGIKPWKFGAHAEFICMRESATLARKPVNMTYAEAASVCDGATLALNLLRPTRIRRGQEVLIYGAAGSIGTAAVQLTKFFGGRVTAVCRMKDFDLLRSLGADSVIDYTKEDFTQNGATYDVIFDAVGKLTFVRCRRSLKRRASYLETDGFVNILLAWLTRIGGRRVVFPIPPRYRKEDIAFLKDLVEAGRYRAVIDRSYPMEQVVEATRYVETGEKTGNVVLIVIPDISATA